MKQRPTQIVKFFGGNQGNCQNFTKNYSFDQREWSLKGGKNQGKAKGKGTALYHCLVLRVHQLLKLGVNGYCVYVTEELVFWHNNYICKPATLSTLVYCNGTVYVYIIPSLPLISTHESFQRWVPSSCWFPSGPQCNENPIYVFPEKDLRGLSPNFHIHVHVCERFKYYQNRSTYFPAAE